MVKKVFSLSFWIKLLSKVLLKLEKTEESMNISLSILIHYEITKIIGLDSVMSCLAEAVVFPPMVRFEDDVGLDARSIGWDWSSTSFSAVGAELGLAGGALILISYFLQSLDFPIV